MEHNAAPAKADRRSKLSKANASQSRPRRNRIVNVLRQCFEFPLFRHGEPPPKPENSTLGSIRGFSWGSSSDYPGNEPWRAAWSSAHLYSRAVAAIARVLLTKG